MPLGSGTRGACETEIPRMSAGNNYRSLAAKRTRPSVTPVALIDEQESRRSGSCGLRVALRLTRSSGVFDSNAARRWRSELTAG